MIGDKKREITSIFFLKQLWNTQILRPKAKVIVINSVFDTKYVKWSHALKFEFIHLVELLVQEEFAGKSHMKSVKT